MGTPAWSSERESIANITTGALGGSLAFAPRGALLACGSACDQRERREHLMVVWK
jgi:hypothetical protein